MKQIRLLTLLALLLTAATGAWADELSESFTTTNGVSDYIGEHFKITVDLVGDDDGFLLAPAGNATIEALNGENITKVEFTKGYYDITRLSCEVGTTTFSGDVATVSGVNQTSLSVTANETLQIKAVKVYYGDAPAGYTISMKDGVKDAGKWTVKVGEGQAQALPIGGLNEGDAVTLQYNGRLKVKGVKATSDAAPAAASLIVNPSVGQIIGSDGKNYDANATLPTGVTAVAKICYVGSDNGEDAPYNHGLALALSDVSTGSYWKTSNTDAGHTKQTSSTFTEESGLQYNDATHNSDNYPAFKAAIANNGTAAPTGCSAWFLASGYQWQKMIDATGLNNLGLQSGYYWSSSESSANDAWDFYSDFGFWGNGNKDYGYLVRSCLAF